MRLIEIDALTQILFFFFYFDFERFQKSFLF